MLPLYDVKTPRVFKLNDVITAYVILWYDVINPCVLLTYAVIAPHVRAFILHTRRHVQMLLQKVWILANLSLLWRNNTDKTLHVDFGSIANNPQRHVELDQQSTVIHT